MYKLYTDISELLTLKQAAQKKGRHITASDLSVIKKAQFITNKGHILWVGTKKKLTPAVLKKLGIQANSIKEISLNDQTVMPGFVECHTHSVFSGTRENEFEQRNSGVSYQDIAKAGGGILSTVHQTRKASLEKLFQLSKNRAQRFLDQGVTTLEIKSGYGLDSNTEIKILKTILKLKKLKKINIVSTYLGPHAVPQKFKSAAEYIDFIIRKVIPILKRKKLIDRADIFIEKGYFGADLAKAYFQALKDHDVSLTAHIDQLSRSGAIAELCLHEKITSLDHLVEMSKVDIKKLSQSECTAVLLPLADFYLKMKYPPARRLIDEGARVALATDFNPGSAPSQDLSMVGVLARLEMKMTLPEVISAYTIGASYALGLAGSHGSLQPGKKADFICLNDHWDRLFYNVGYHPISSTWVQGRRLNRL